MSPLMKKVSKEVLKYGCIGGAIYGTYVYGLWDDGLRGQQCLQDLKTSLKHLGYESIEISTDKAKKTKDQNKVMMTVFDGLSNAPNLPQNATDTIKKAFSS